MGRRAKRSGFEMDEIGEAVGTLTAQRRELESAKASAAEQQQRLLDLETRLLSQQASTDEASRTLAERRRAHEDEAGALRAEVAELRGELLARGKEANDRERYMGRLLNSPDAYGVPHAKSQRRRRKRREEPTSPNPTRRQLRLADARSPSASTRSRTALTRHVAFPALS